MHKTIPAYSESRSELTHKNWYMQLSTTTAKRRNSSASGGSKKKRQKTSAFQKQQANVGASIRANVIEWKNVDIGSQLAIAASTSSFSTPVMLNPVGQGTGNNDRIGRKIAMTKLQLRWERWQGTGVPDPFRILVVYDRFSKWSNTRNHLHFIRQRNLNSRQSVKHRPFSHPYGYLSMCTTRND